MRIGLNLLYLIPGHVGGTETYARALIDALAGLDRDNEYLLYLNRACRTLPWPDSPTVRVIPTPVPPRCRSLRYAWEQLILPLQATGHRLDVLHSLGYVGPLRAPCPTVVTVHDMNYFTLGDMIGFPRRQMLQFFGLRSMRRAACVTTISHFAQEEILRHAGLAEEKVRVIHLGRGQMEGGDRTDRAGGGGTEAEGAPWLIAFAGGAHKNIDRLLRVFDRLRDRVPHRLLLIGSLPAEVRAAAGESLAALTAAGRLTELGFVEGDRLRTLLAGADLMVFPSLYEGFGLPVLEAQELGTAVACSTAASLPEVAGEGAAFFDPESEEEMEDVIGQCLLRPEHRQRLVELGRINLERFSWRQAAGEMLEVYREVAVSRSKRSR